MEWGIWVFSPASKGAIGGEAHAEDVHGGGAGDGMVWEGDGGGARSNTDGLVESFSQADLW